MTTRSDPGAVSRRDALLALGAAAVTVSAAPLGASSPDSAWVAKVSSGPGEKSRARRR